jgi:hypothetical protein
MVADDRRLFRTGGHWDLQAPFGIEIVGETPEPELAPAQPTVTTPAVLQLLDAGLIDVEPEQPEDDGVIVVRLGLTLVATPAGRRFVASSAKG